MLRKPVNKIAPSLVLSLAVALPATSHAMRCGTHLVQKGDLKYEVSSKCGQPEYRESTGYIDEERRGKRIKVLSLEEWVYKISSSYYRLEFKGNELVKVESRGRI